MDITSQNPEEETAKQSDEFINFWVPVLRKFRETVQWGGVQLYPSMNKCIEIMEKALHTWEMKMIVELLRDLSEDHAIGRDRKWWEDNHKILYAHAEIYGLIATLVEAYETGDEANWWDHNSEHLHELVEQGRDA